MHASWALSLKSPLRLSRLSLWICLEIDLPEGHDVVVDDGEIDLGESIEAAEQEELKWNDVGLDLLLHREGPTTSNNN